jgi:hypothetical protein
MDVATAGAFHMNGSMQASESVRREREGAM